MLVYGTWRLYLRSCSVNPDLSQVQQALWTVGFINSSILYAGWFWIASVWFGSRCTPSFILTGMRVNERDAKQTQQNDLRHLSTAKQILPNLRYG